MKKTGILLTRELRAFADEMAKKYHLDIPVAKFASVRKIGTALHLKRRLAVPRRLRLELQLRSGDAFFCALFEDSGSYYAVRTTVQHNTNGDVTIVETQTSTSMHLYNPEQELFECPTTETDSDYDPEFDYGTSTGPDTITYSSSVDVSGLRDAAIGNIADNGAPYDEFDLNWMSDVAPPATSDVIALGSASGFGLTSYAFSYKYRWIVTGPATHLEWTQGGTSHTLDLPANTTSSWYEDTIPGTADTPDAITDLIIS